MRAADGSVPQDTQPGKPAMAMCWAGGGRGEGEGLRNQRARGGELIHHRSRKYMGLLRVTATPCWKAGWDKLQSYDGLGKGPFEKGPCGLGFIRGGLFLFFSVSEYELVSQTPALKLAAVTTASVW